MSFICWFILWLVSSDVGSAFRGPGSLLSRRKGASHPWKNFNKWFMSTKSDDEALLGESDDGVTADVYFVRHGQNKGNVWVQKHPPLTPFPEDVSDGYWDGMLTEQGVSQALRAQEILNATLGLGKVSPSRVQLAASLNSRAFDTLVIGSAPLWQSWQSSGASFEMHGIPAAMELDTSVNSRRFPGVANDSPALWAGSVLSGSHANLAKVEGARELFYQTAEDRQDISNTTRKPVQVQAHYQRAGASLSTGKCDPEQMSNLNAYLVASAKAGKKHILLGSHGFVIICMIWMYSPDNGMSVSTSSGGTVALNYGTVGNGAVVHARLRVSGDKPGVLIPQMLHYNPIESY